MPMNFFSAIRGFPFLIDYSGLKIPKQTSITEISLDLDDLISLRTKVLENPGNTKKPVIYLQHGMSFKGIDDERILALGNNLANRGFRVYLPELPEVKNLLIRSETISNIRAAFLRIHALEKRSVSYLSASFSAGMGFVALANQECQKILTSAFLIGTFSDFRKTLPFVLKNYGIESYAVNVMMYNYIHLIRSQPEILKKYFLESALDNGLSRTGNMVLGPKIFSSLEEGDIVLEGAILNSTIDTLGSIVLSGSNGNLVSSKIRTNEGISVISLGSSAELDVTVELGFHFKNDRAFQEISRKIQMGEKEMEKILPKIQQIKHMVQRSRGNLPEDKKTAFKTIFEDYNKKIKILNLLKFKQDSLKSARFNSGAVRLAVQKGAFPGTVIHYRRQVEKITKFQSSFMMVFEPGQEKAIMVALQIK
ncbi:FapA family protein [Leptospira borgpetersenii]|uniref:FapA family protein n=1 Tax=Leptospira borgpetersenii TaxID=174 RepID=UPI0009B820CE|nr:FapA family protein [Leptospira borgpetersenii]